MFRQVFGVVANKADEIPTQLDDSFAYEYRTILLVAQHGGSRIKGFALVNHFPQVNSSFLDFLATAPDLRSGGIGGALYEAVREHLQTLGSRGLYSEVLPDDPAVVHDPTALAENRKRMRFYERYGAYPIVGTEYETPIDEDPAPHLLFDPLNRKTPLGRAECRSTVRRILQRKYGRILQPDYIERVVESILDDPVRLREPRYIRREAPVPVATGRVEKIFALVYTDVHKIHHVQERGYVERPARVKAIRQELLATGQFDEVPVRHQPEADIRRVHDEDFVRYLKAVCQKLSPAHPVYPYVFPVRRPERRPRDMLVRAGYYCIDTFTPLDGSAFTAARTAVDVALSAADETLAGRRVTYALCRPPGHHAERRVFGGFCYFNNAAIAAHRLSAAGRVAMLDLDFHHGNGAQDIFYRRADVLTLSIHGHPNQAYPYFSGFADERGDGPGRDFNRNFPLSERCGAEAFFAALDAALKRVRDFNPAFLVVPLGFDTMRGDPTGSFDLAAGDLEQVGMRLGGLDLPLLIVQEGGYDLGNLRTGSRSFFRGVARGLVRIHRTP